MENQANKIELQFYSVGQCSAILGLGRSATYQLVREGRLRAVRLGNLRSLRVPAIELKRFCDEAVNALQGEPATH